VDLRFNHFSPQGQWDSRPVIPGAIENPLV
jgi:hypothetical protein